MMHGFWDITFGNLLTLGALLLSFWSAHRGNVKRIEDGAAKMARLETKVEELEKEIKQLFDWWCNTWRPIQRPEHSGD